MSLQNIVNANIVIAGSQIQAQPLDVPILGVTLTAPQDAAWGPDLVREVRLDTWQATMAEVGITDGEAIYEWLQLAFGQDDVPRLVLLGKRATPQAQVTNFDLGLAGTAADGLYRLTINGVNYDEIVTGGATTRAAVITALIATINGGTDPITAAPGGGAEDLDVTADEAGANFVFAASAPAGETWTLATTTPNVGLSSDLTAWEAERQDWYLVTIAEPVSYGLADGFAQTLAAYPRDITGWLRTDTATDPDAATTSATRTAALLAAKGYARLVVPHIPTATDYDHAAIIGLKMPTLPGSDTWAKLVRGVDGERWTTTEGANLISGPYARFERVDALGRAWAQNVRVVDGTPYDTIRGADYLKASIIAAVINKLTKTPAPGYDQPGFADVVAGVANTQAEFERTGFLAATRPDGTPGSQVTIPAVPPIGDPDRVARKMPPIQWSALVRGSIEIVDEIDGILFQ
jgi:hypothetical protein